ATHLRISLPLALAGNEARVIGCQEGNGCQVGALFKRNRRVRKGQPARVKSLRSHASAWHTMVCRSSKSGCHLSKERARSEAATICAGSPARRPTNATSKSTPCRPSALVGQNELIA